MPASKTAPKTSAKKAPVRKSAPKKAETTWIRQSTVAPAEGIAKSRFTTQTQRKLLRQIVKERSVSFADAKAPTLRSLDRLGELGYVAITPAGVAKPTKSGAAFVAESPAPIVRGTSKPAPKKAPVKKAPARKTPVKKAAA